MHSRRAKACNACRLAKSKCSLSIPCLRCEKRHLDCLYPPASHEHRRMRLIRPAVQTIAPANSGDPASIVTLGFSSDAQDCLEQAQVCRPIAAADGHVSDLVIYSGDTTSQLTPHLADTRVFPDYIDLDYGLAASNFFVDQLSSSWCEDVDSLSSHTGVSFDNQARELFGVPATSTQLTSPSSQAVVRQFSRRERSLQQGLMTAKMLMSRLGDYARMMAEAKSLPPFIHPPCCLGQKDECLPDGPHRCLPEKLAVCASLCQRFYNRIPGTLGYVWRQICAHIRQLQSEVGFATFTFSVLFSPC